MKRFKSAAGLALAVLAVLGLAGPVAAGEQVPFKGILEGTYARTGSFPFFHVELSGAGLATQLGVFTLDMPHDLNLLAPPPLPNASGDFEFTAANGDTVYGTFTGRGGPSDMPGFTLRVEETMTITGGTGRFAGASGIVIAVRYLDGSNFIGAFEGTISSPGK
jgi:hypothetical protein